MNGDTNSRSSGRDFFLAFLSLLAVLALLFHRSFLPGEVLFSNDGPLGAMKAQTIHSWDNLRGYWQDLNWLGGKQPGGFLSLGYLTFAVLGPVLVSKFMVPISLLLLGLSAWFFFRQMGFHPVACVLGGLAAALNTDAVSISCWGLPGWTLARACVFLALAALPHGSVTRIWIRTALAGLAVGLALMDGFDVGAIFSLYIAAYVVFQTFVNERKCARDVALGIGRVAVVAVCAGLVAAQALITLVGTQVKGVAGMEQDQQAKAARWEEATQWSLPKAEALRLIIPGLFGYRTHGIYGDLPRPADSSSYWGAMGRGPGQFRHSGGGEFAGVLVTLIAVWASVQSFRRKNNPFTDSERKHIWFWSGATILSLLLAFGKYAPFYQLVYAIPYFSTIRNPFKFLHPLQVTLVVQFAYGLHGLCRRYLAASSALSKSAINQLKAWWRTAPSFDRRWTIGSIVALVASLIGWLVYASSRNEIARHLKQMGFPDERVAASIVRFSLGEVGLFVLFLAASVGLVTFIMSGAFGGQRRRWAGVALGLLLVIDLVRADTPWIVYWNYPQKYSSNPIVDQLSEQPHQHRVTARLAPFSAVSLDMSENQVFTYLFGVEWLQQLFQYYRIQSLEVVQMPRIPNLDKNYMAAFFPTNQANLFPAGRLWELTNTRLVLGSASVLDTLNTQLDPAKHRFRLLTGFAIALKPGISEPTKWEHLTALTSTNGPYALFEFTGALPRAKLFTQWEVNTNDAATLERLRSPGFDPAESVLVADNLPTPSGSATNAAAGTVEISRYEPKTVQLEAATAAPAVLLLNDRFDPDWKVFVDGKREMLLRCNYIMRGVLLAPGKHRVEFHFEPPATAFYISLSALLAGLGLCGFLAISSRREKSPAAKPTLMPAVVGKN